METLRFVGNCQACEADHKLRGDLMVHHGYRRPGDGEIHGDCDGVGFPPYELSCEWIKARLVYLEAALVSTREHLAKLPEVTTLYVAPAYWGAESVTYALCVTAPAYWEQALAGRERDLEWRIKAILREIARRTARVAAWVLAPVREVTEESIQTEQLAARKARMDERQAARDVKAKKAADYKAKQEARAGERASLLLGFAVKFRELALLPEGAERAHATKMHVREIEKRKHQRFGWWTPDNLGCDEALVTLGLASPSGKRGDGSTLYSYEIYPPWR